MCDSSALSIVGTIPLPVIFNINVFSFCFRRLNFRLKSGKRTKAFFFMISSDYSSHDLQLRLAY